ncbi:MAG: VWA domain-containing protein [Planctomycetota bacterium]
MRLDFGLAGALVVLSWISLVPVANAANLPKARAAIQAAEKAKNYEEIRNILGHLGASEDEKAVALIVDTLTRVPIQEINEASVDAFVALGSERCAKTFDKLFKGKNLDERILVIVLAAAQKMNDPTSEGWLVKAVESGQYFLYRTSVPVLVERRSKLAIPALIDLLDKVGYNASTESYQIRDALLSLTGNDMESIADWRRFWDEQGATFDPRSVGKETGRSGVDRTKPKGFKQPKFFDVEVLSDRVVFVVDVSGSMRMWDADAAQVGEGPEHRTKERLARLKFQLEKAIVDLPEHAHFNVIAYGWSTKSFNPTAVPATAQWKKKAAEFVRNLKADGLTPTDDAMRLAFEDTAVDTIFLLSDGHPTRQGKKSKDLMAAILEDTRKRNRVAKVKIFTLGFEGEGSYPPGTSPPPPGKDDDDNPTTADLVDFLKKLAEENGGTYSPVK